MALPPPAGRDASAGRVYTGGLARFRPGSTPNRPTLASTPHAHRDPPAGRRSRAGDGRVRLRDARPRAAGPRRRQRRADHHRLHREHRLHRQRRRHPGRARNRSLASSLARSRGDRRRGHPLRFRLGGAGRARLRRRSAPPHRGRDRSASRDRSRRRSRRRGPRRVGRAACAPGGRSAGGGAGLARPRHGVQAPRRSERLRGRGVQRAPDRILRFGEAGQPLHAAHTRAGREPDAFRLRRRGADRGRSGAGPRLGPVGGARARPRRSGVSADRRERGGRGRGRAPPHLPPRPRQLRPRPAAARDQPQRVAARNRLRAERPGRSHR